VTEPVGGYLTGRNTPGAIPATTVAPVFPPPQTPQPQAQVPQPVSPPGQDEALAKAKATGQSVPFGNQGMFVNPDGTVGAPPAAPIGGTARGTPVASAAPTSLGGRILGALNPVSSAQAAENPPEQQLAVAQAQAKDSNAPVKMADGRTVNPNGTVDNPPAQGVTTAQPPKGATPPTQAGPVKVSGATGEVVPGQKGPSTQSESTPPVLGPSVSPGAYLRMATANPAMKQLVDDVVAAHGGGGAVSVYDVAAVAERESGWKVDAQAHGAMGAGQGLMQIEPDTQAGLLKALPGLEASLGHRFDPFNAKDNLIMGTEYLKYLALTKGYGSGTVQMHLAYMRGDGAERGVARLQQVGWEQYAKEQPIAAKGLMRLYDDKLKIDTSMFPGGGTYDARQLVNATHQSGPDATLHMLATTGPAGLGMTDRWRSAQAALEYAAIRSGHMDMLPQINDWISQTSHQGAVSNLMAADQALLSGNMQGASDALAKAHAFFPDGTYARIGATDDGRLWATQLSERDGKPMGKPFQVTHEMLASQIIAMQNPSNYVQALQKFQLTNAQIELAHAHAGYYQDLPEQRREAAALRAQTQEDATEQRRQAAQQHNETMLEQQRMRGEQAAGNTAAAERPVDAHIAKDYGADGTPPPVDVNGQPMSSSRYAAMGEVQRAFQYPSKSGGGAISAPLARDYAEKFMKGQWHLAPSKERDASGNPTGYGLVDEKGNPHGYLSTDMGNRILNLQGTERVQTGTGRQAAIGAGAGSYAALQSGYNQNLSNQPTQALTQAA
jgi:hypothetical protein